MVECEEALVLLFLMYVWEYYQYNQNGTEKRNENADDVENPNDEKAAFTTTTISTIIRLSSVFDPILDGLVAFLQF